MEIEIHLLLEELFKRYRTRKDFFLNKYFKREEYDFDDVQQDFYLKMYDGLLRNPGRIDKITSKSYFDKALKNFILDHLEKQKKGLLNDYEDDELFPDGAIALLPSHDDNIQKHEILLSDLISNFSVISKEIIIQHFIEGTTYKDLNEYFNLTNTSKKTAALLTKMRIRIDQILVHNELLMGDVIIHNDLTE